MLEEFIKELEFNQNINMEKGLENRVDIDYVIEKLKSINMYFEVARAEVECAIEDIHNDDLYNYQSIQDNLDNLTDEDINRIAWKVEDYDIWDDIYECARGEVLEKVYEEEENEENE